MSLPSSCRVAAYSSKSLRRRKEPKRSGLREGRYGSGDRSRSKPITKPNQTSTPLPCPAWGDQRPEDRAPGLGPRSFENTHTRRGESTRLTGESTTDDQILQLYTRAPCLVIEWGTDVDDRDVYEYSGMATAATLKVARNALAALPANRESGDRHPPGSKEMSGQASKSVWQELAGPADPD